MISEKIVCELLKKLKAHLEKSGNINEAKKHLKSFIDKIKAEGLSKDVNPKTSLQIFIVY